MSRYDLRINTDGLWTCHRFSLIYIALTVDDMDDIVRDAQEKDVKWASLDTHSPSTFFDTSHLSSPMLISSVLSLRRETAPTSTEERLIEFST